jgi:hypothetical protein
MLHENNQSNHTLSQTGTAEQTSVSGTLMNTSSVPVRINSTNIMQHTVILSITADESRLVPDVIFKRKTMPKVEFSSGIHITVQKKKDCWN